MAEHLTLPLGVQAHQQGMPDAQAEQPGCVSLAALAPSVHWAIQTAAS